MKTKNASCTERVHTPRVGVEIVWRFKDNKGWSVGFVREVMGGRRVIRITETPYSSGYSGSNVAVSDIDWHAK